MEGPDLACYTPWAEALGVTRRLFHYIKSNRGGCCFVSTRALRAHYGNPPVLVHKLEALQSMEELDALPQLVLNPDEGQIVLMEGNHRLETYHKRGIAWFPVSIRVLRGPLIVGRGTVDTHYVYPQYDPAEGSPVWLLHEVFGVDVLDLDGHYTEEYFIFLE